MRYGYWARGGGRCGAGPGAAERRSFGRGEDAYGAHRGRGGFGRSGRRVFDQGDLRAVILSLIAEKPRHGYELIKAIEEMLGGGYAPSPGIVYPTLTYLEEAGQIALASSEGGKKLYAISPEGEAYLAANQAAMAALKARVAAAREMFAGGRAPQIVRAMENLKLALRLRMERGALDEAAAAAIAGALDAAAQAVERT